MIDSGDLYVWVSCIHWCAYIHCKNKIVILTQNVVTSVACVVTQSCN